MDVGAFRPKLTIALCKILANVIGSASKIVAERTRLPSLTRALAEKLARDMRGVLFARRTPWPFKSASRRHGPDRLRLAVPIWLAQSIRNVETPSAHVSVGWYLRRRSIARAAVPGIRCGAVAEHRDFFCGYGSVRVGGVRRTDETRPSLVGSPIVRDSRRRGQGGVSRDVAARQCEFGESFEQVESD